MWEEQETMPLPLAVQDDWLTWTPPGWHEPFLPIRRATLFGDVPDVPKTLVDEDEEDSEQTVVSLAFCRFLHTTKKGVA